MWLVIQKIRAQLVLNNFGQLDLGLHTYTCVKKLQPEVLETEAGMNPPPQQLISPRAEFK